MKKLIVFALVLSLVAVFAACSVEVLPEDSEDYSVSEETTVEESSVEESVVEESSVEESVVEESSEEESVVEESSEEETSAEESTAEESKETVDAADVEVSKDVSKTDGTNIALGCTVSGVEVNTANPVYNANLTDGIAVDGICYDGNWFGIWKNAEKGNAPDGTAKFVVDLGSEKAIELIRMNTFLGNCSGILAPETVKFEVAGEDGKYTSLGKQSFDVAAENDTTVDWIGYALASPVNARYVRITVTCQANWTFINEIEVYD